MYLKSNIPYIFLFTIFFTLLFLFPTQAQDLPQPFSNQDSTSADSDKNAIKTIGYLQQQFTHNTKADDPAKFTIYRARAGISGEIINRISVNILAGAVEPPDRDPQLVNAFVDFDIVPLLNIRTGQFLAPFGLEGQEVITFNPAIERSIATSRLNPLAMYRDIGIQANGSTDFFNYSVALVNGDGANTTEPINLNDVLGRIGFAPTEQLEIGVSGHLGTYIKGDDPENGQTRIRAGTDLSYESAPLLFRSEFMIREDDLPGNTSINQRGGYLLGAYHFTPKLQSLFRFEYHDPDTSVGDDQLTSWTVGINYYFVGQTRISANYELRNDRANPEFGDLFTIQLQFSL